MSTYLLEYRNDERWGHINIDGTTKAKAIAALRDVLGIQFPGQEFTITEARAK